MRVKRIIISCLIVAGALSADAAWYWPFGDKSSSTPRLSVLMTGVTERIEFAVECLERGDTHGAVTNYMGALDAIADIRESNSNLVVQSEFQSIRNREAYIEAAIESLLLKQVRDTAKTVVISDTDDLVARLDDEIRARRGVGARVEPEPIDLNAAESNAAFQVVQNVHSEPQRDPTREELLARIDGDIAAGDYQAAELAIRKMLEFNRSDASVLNLRAALEVAKGEFLLADATLRHIINDVAPDSYAGYYNLARLNLRKDPPDPRAAARYYKAGRDRGGEPNAELERQLKSELKKPGGSGK